MGFGEGGFKIMMEMGIEDRFWDGGWICRLDFGR